MQLCSPPANDETFWDQQPGEARIVSYIHLGVTFIGVIGRCTGQVWKLQSVDVKTVKNHCFGGNKHPLAS